MKRMFKPSSDQLHNLEHQQAQRQGDFGLVLKALSFDELDPEERVSFENMLRDLTLKQTVLTRAQRSWGHRVVRECSPPKQPRSPMGDRSPVVGRTPADAKAWRKVEQWCAAHGPRSTEPSSVPEQASAPTGDRSPVTTTPDDPKRASKTKRKQRLARRRENRLNKWIDAHQGGASSR